MLLINSCDSKKETQINITDTPFNMPEIELPVIPGEVYNIKDYGAVGDGLTNDQLAIQLAIDTCAAQGGGKVVIPAGLWLTGPIRLKSNVELHLETGSILQFTDNFDDYPLMSYKYEKRKAVTCQPPLYGVDLENIAITGKGVIDGAGSVWRPVKKYKLTENQWRNLLHSGGVTNEEGDVWYPSANALYGSIKIRNTDNQRVNSDTLVNLASFEDMKDFLRPVLIKLENCTRVLLDGPTFQNSPSWNIHPLMCKHITIRDIMVRNPWYSQNGDGLDLESCSIGLVENCTFDVGDDAICLKSGKDKEGRDRNIPTEKIIIRDNIVYHGHGGFVIGSEMSGGIRDIFVTNCSFIGTDIGLRFKSARGRGGVVENIYVNNICMTSIPAAAIHFTTYYEGRAPLEEDEDDTEQKGVRGFSEETPVFTNFTISNIICNGANSAISISGLDEMYIKNILFKDIIIKSKYGFYLFNADSIVFNNTKLVVENRPATVIRNGKNIEFYHFDINNEAQDSLFYVSGEKSGNILVDKSYDLESQVILGDKIKNLKIVSHKK